MQLIYISCFIFAVILPLRTANAEYQQAPRREDAVELSCVISDEVNCSLLQSDHPGDVNAGKSIPLEVAIGQTVKVAIRSKSKYDTSWHWRDNSTENPTVHVQHRQDDIVFEFQVTERHAGVAILQCGNNSTNFTLSMDINIKPTLKRPTTPVLRVVEGEVGRAEVFVCSSEGHPDPEITWYKDARKAKPRPRLPPSKTGNAVESRLSSYNTQEAAVMCCASNTLGEECTLLHSYDLDEPNKASPPVQAILGHTLLLRCRSQNYYDHDWYINGSKADHFSRLSGSYMVSAYLFLNVSDLPDGAEISCKSSNNKEQSVKLNVVEKGFINLLALNEVNTIRANEMSSFCFEAAVHSWPLAECHWKTPNGQKLKCQGEENRWEGKSSYKLCPKEAGAYQLQLENRDTTVIRNLSLCVTERPTTPVLRVVEGGVGRAEVFVCSSEGHPDPEITWYKDARKAKPRPRLPPSKTGNAVESRLSSYNTQEAAVMCCASNTLEEECTLLHSYDLDEPNEASPPVQAILGHTLLLRCRSQDYDVDHDWYINGSKADHFSRLSGPSMASAYLFLNVSDLPDGAEISCKSSNNKEQSVKLNVVEKGFINLLALNEVNTIRANETSSFCFEAAVHSWPLAECHWKTPNGQKLECQGEENRWEGKSSYKLCPKEAGAYQLQLENRDTTVIRNLSLCVTDTPAFDLRDNGTAVTCMTSSPRSWELTWVSCQYELYEQHNCQNSSMWEEVFPAPSAEVSASPTYCHDTIVSSLPSEEHQGQTLRCCLHNLAGKHCSEQIIKPSTVHPEASRSQSGQDNSSLLLGVIAMLVMIVVLATTSCLYFMRKKKPVYQSQLQMIQMVGSSDNDYIYIDFKDFKYDQKWEFPRENLELGKELGAGAFGRVVQATAYGITKPGVSMQVAVKMLKDKHQSVEREALMSELKMLSYIGNHANIVNLLGACTCSSGPPYLIFQFCCNGDLLNYLKSNRERFHKCLTDAITKDRFTSLYHNYQPKQNTSEYQSPASAYVSMSPAKDQESLALLGQSPATDGLSEVPVGVCHVEECLDDLEDLEEDEDLNLLTFGDLLSFSYQVAKGMEFLSSKNCIHRDLAARNVLVTRGRLVKIGDFGLARDIDNDSNYVVRGNARLPVKWMAPESIFKGMYTMESDVWAYGILLWEIFSLGVTPYPGMKVDTHFYSLIERGFQMEQPYYASESVYQVMRRCWALEPEDRPCFSKLVVVMETELADMEEKIYLNISKQDNSSSLYQNLPDELEEPAGYQTAAHSEDTAHESHTEEATHTQDKEI